MAKTRLNNRDGWGCYYGSVIRNLKPGQLATYLEANRIQNCSLELSSGSVECELWWATQRAHPGYYFACPSCGCDMVLSRCGARRYKASRRKFAQHESTCPSGAGQTLSPILTAEEVYALADANDVGVQRYVNRFSLSLDRVSRRVWRNRAFESGTGRPSRRATTHSLLGFIKLLTELARLNVWFPQRSYATDFPHVIPCIARVVASADATSTLSLLRRKTVFPENGRFLDSSLAAVDAPTNLKGLEGRAVVIGRLFSIKSSSVIELTLTGMGEHRLAASKTVWGSLCRSFGDPTVPLPRQDHTEETLLVAVVALQASQFQVQQAAWARIDRHGIVSESRHEHSAVLELIRGGHSFVKPQLFPLKVGKHAMLADFLLLTKPLLVLEVDPRGSVKSRRKILRTSRFEAAKQGYISYDPTASTNLSEVIRTATAVLETS